MVVRLLVLCLSVLCVCVLCSATTVPAAEPIEGIGPAGEMTKLHTDFEFTEGPADDGEGNVYFSDIPADKILMHSASGELTVFCDHSNHANGLMFGNTGELIACEMDGQVVAWDVAEKSRRVLAGQFNEARFNAPNDLVVDTAGGFYFTDPHYRAPQPLPQGTLGVYYVTAAGEVSRIAADLPAPNGILLSPDEKTLYVLPSRDQVMMAYSIIEPGKLGAGWDFCTLPTGSPNSGADGAAVDTNGNLYITSERGIEVVSPDGKLLGVIEVPEKPANVTFGGKDRKMLYITARTSLYAVPMIATGHRYGGR